jgi:acyl carrier protein
MSESASIFETSDVARRIRDIICDSLDVTPEEVTPEASFVETLGADSLDVVDLAIRFENEFSMSIKDKDYLYLTRLCDATAYIEGRMNGTIPGSETSAPAPMATEDAGASAGE